MKVKLRSVCEGDCDLLYEWANNYEVRQNALNPNEIIWEEHKLWFKRKLNSPNAKIFILENDKLPVGQIRYDKREGAIWQIDFSIIEQFQGQGLGKKIVELSLDKISGTIEAIVKKENVASMKVFERLGFIRKEFNNGTFQYIYR